MPAASITTDSYRAASSFKPESITAFMLGLKSRMATFRVQRTINEYGREPLLAILPGVALSELWQMMNVLENTLRLISVLILIAALLGLSAMLLASIRERNREVQLLRVVGASSDIFISTDRARGFADYPAEHCAWRVIAEMSGLVTAGDFLASEYGLYIQSNILSAKRSALGAGRYHC